ncbi:MAG: PDZ domain-containing protein [bacterium]
MTLRRLSSLPHFAAAMFAFTAVVPAGLRAQQLEAVRYVVRFAEPRTHYMEVEGTFPTSGKPTVELMMAVWTPGSYLVREFARNVEAVQARDAAGRPLAIQKSRKNRWVVQTGGGAHVVVTYRVYAHERAARLDWVDDGYALVNGAPTYITLAERAKRPHEVLLQLPAEWSRSISPLPAADGTPHHYRAVDYDMLVDSPILAGNPSVRTFAVDGVEHALVNVGDTTIWNGARSVADIERIVRAAKSLWGSLPYERYVFFNILTDSYDGIEHKGSTVLFADRWSTRTPDGYHEWLSLAAHEFTHAWNVKRLRPVELGPFDYENEVHTKNLWIAEGFTDYYSWMLNARAGLATAARALADVSNAILSLQTTPGRLVQPVEMASYDAWIKQYRPDENSPNVSISYYTKGSLVALLLDARVRHVTRGARSLDDVMRLAYQRYSGEHGYTSAQFRAVASEVAGADLGEFFRRAVESTDELDYAEFLEWYGVAFAPSSSGGGAWFGAATRVSGGRVYVSLIPRGSPAYGSGLDVDDELVSIDGFPGAGGLAGRLAQYQPGARVQLLVSRHGESRRIDVTLGTAPSNPWSLMVRQDATAEQKARLAAWLSGS